MSAKTEAVGSAGGKGPGFGRAGSAGSGTSSDDDDRQRRSPKGPVKLPPRNWNVTLPDDDDFYLVREDQLDILHKGGKNMAMEWVFFSGGAALGLLPNALSLIVSLWNRTEVSTLDVVLTVAFAALAAFAVARLLDAKGRRTDVDVLLGKIKSGQKLEGR